MALLKEDGSLDVERINKLPLDEHIKEIESLTEEQYKEYLSRLPINESQTPMHAVMVDYTLEDELSRGCVIAEDFVNNLGKRFEGE
jgi:hypothetical protein